MPFEANIGAIVQSYLERFDELCEIEMPKRKKILRIDWRDIEPDFEVIGEGTYSIVHKVKLLDYKGEYALKFLDPSMLKDNSGEERYKRAAMDVALEGKILERLDHPNIISLRGLCKGQVEENINNESFPYFILLDYLPQTLDNVLQQKRKSASEKLIRTQRKAFDRLEVTAVGIASAMEYLHERGRKFAQMKRF
jgi:serine/threonine protein kinase